MQRTSKNYEFLRDWIIIEDLAAFFTRCAAKVDEERRQVITDFATHPTRIQYFPDPDAVIVPVFLEDNNEESILSEFLDQLHARELDMVSETCEARLACCF